MPKTRHTKRSGSASSGKSEKRVKRIARIAPGENKAGLTPAIPFCEAEKDANDADDEYVSIKVVIDPGKAESRSNLEEKKFRKIIDLTYNGPLIVQVRRSLDLDLFGPQALTGREHTFTRLGHFERLLTGNAKDKFCKIYKMVSVMMLTKWDIDKDDPDQFRALQGSRTLFNQWVFEDEELNAYELSLPVEEQKELTAKLTTGHESAEQFEKLLWFELGKLIWKDHRQVYHDHIEYLQQSINKPFKWPMVRYISRIREMFDYCLYLQPHSLKNQSSYEACWDERDKPAPEKVIRKAIKDGLPEDMQNELSDKETDYREMSEEKLMDTLTTIEQRMSAIGQPIKKHRTKSKLLRRNYARLASLGTAITPTSAASRATTTTAEELLVSVPYARMPGCQSASTCPTLTPTAKIKRRWPEEPWVVAWPTRVSKYASTRKSRRLSRRSSARCRVGRRSSQK